MQGCIISLVRRGASNHLDPQHVLGANRVEDACRATQLCSQLCSLRTSGKSGNGSQVRFQACGSTTTTGAVRALHDEPECGGLPPAEDIPELAYPFRVLLIRRISDWWVGQVGGHREDRRERGGGEGESGREEGV